MSISRSCACNVARVRRSEFDGVSAEVLLGFGATAAGLNGSVLERSDDGVAWTTVLTVSGMTDAGGLITFGFTAVSARYWRLRKNASAVATTELRFYASYALNTQVRVELESVRDGLTSQFKHDYTITRA